MKHRSLKIGIFVLMGVFFFSVSCVCAETNIAQNQMQPSLEAHALSVKGMQLMKEGRYREAADTFEQVIEKYPNLFQGYISLGASYHYLREPEKSIEVYKRGIKEIPPYAWLFQVNIAGEYNLLGRYNEALEAANKAIELNPDDYMPYLMLGTVYFASGEKNKAKVNFESALEKAKKANNLEGIKQVEQALRKVNE